MLENNHLKLPEMYKNTVVEKINKNKYIIRILTANLNVVHFFTTSVKLDICGSLRWLFSSIGAYYTLFYW
jgi:hypothetical protein